MPELPEVETTRRGIEPHVQGQTVCAVTVRDGRLRWPVPADLAQTLVGQTVLAVERRAKYLLFRFAHGTLIAHLGMSGSLRVVEDGAPAKKHDHVEVLFAHGLALRYHDPRRFGCLVWTPDDPARHRLLAALGPEPFDPRFTGGYLRDAAEGKQLAVKAFIMDGHLVVGVGNIYASEALFRAGIDPRRAAGRVSLPRYVRLAEQIKGVLGEAIQQGGTTLRDFVNASGKPGYFQQTLSVYGREGEPCRLCAAPVRCVRLAQRSTFFCAHCQR